MSKCTTDTKTRQVSKQSCSNEIAPSPPLGTFRLVNNTYYYSRREESSPIGFKKREKANNVNIFTLA